MVLLTSAIDCESVVVCYNGQNSPPYFALSPHSVLTPRLFSLSCSLYLSQAFYFLLHHSEQLHRLRGLPLSSYLPMVGLRFNQPAIGAAVVSLDNENFAALMVSGRMCVCVYVCMCVCTLVVSVRMCVCVCVP